MISATIITIGDELLIGQTIDTNSAWIGQQFNKIGIQIKRRIAIADEETEIISALKEASKLSEIVITTGGLGPTNDDITKEVLCKYFNSKLKQDDTTLLQIKEFFLKKGRELLKVNLDQALVPDNCTVLYNAVGTAPGMHFKEDNTYYFALPGVPFEMKHLISERIIPILLESFTLGGILHKTLITSGLGESFIAHKLINFETNLHKGISLAYLPNFGMVKLRLSSNSNLKNEVDLAFNYLKSTLSDILISEEDNSIEQILFDILINENKTIAIAESCTGGNIAAKIVSISGASKVFMGSTVTYALESKKNILGIRKETLDKDSDVSEQTAIEMAQNVRERFNADYGLSTTGYLEGEEQHFFTAFSSDKKTTVNKFNLRYKRILNSNYAVSTTLQFVIRILLQNKKDAL